MKGPQESKNKVLLGNVDGMNKYNLIMTKKRRQVALTCQSRF